MERQGNCASPQELILTSPDSEQELLLENVDDRTNTASSTERSDDHDSKFSKILDKAKSAISIRDAKDIDKTNVVLKREITPLSGIGFVVGQLIGSGIFITPSAILKNTGSFGLSLVCWGIGAIVALAGSLCYFELGLLVRKAGGEYAILLEAYSFHKKNPWVEALGSLIAFLFTWTTVFVLRGASVSIITLACARYLTRPFFIDCDVPESVVKLLALTVLSTFILCVHVYYFNIIKPMVIVYKLVLRLICKEQYMYISGLRYK